MLASRRVEHLHGVVPEGSDEQPSASRIEGEMIDPASYLRQFDGPDEPQQRIGLRRRCDVGARNREERETQHDSQRRGHIAPYRCRAESSAIKASTRAWISALAAA